MLVPILFNFIAAEIGTILITINFEKKSVCRHLRTKRHTRMDTLQGFVIIMLEFKRFSCLVFSLTIKKELSNDPSHY